MTDTAKLRELRARATGGSWFISGVRFKMDRSEWHRILSYNEASKQDDDICCVGYDPRTGLGRADAALIVTVVNELIPMCDELDRLRDLVRALLENDPDELAADGGVTVLDVWRKDARTMLKARSETL